MEAFFERILNISEIRVLPFLLIGIIFLNRYVFGSFLLSLNKRSQRKEKKTTWIKPPTVCVIVPVYNEGPTIAETIRSIQEQDYPKHLLNYIIIDDCSKDDSAAWAQQAIGEDLRGMVLRNRVNMGKRLGLVKAVRMTKADIVVSVDSDVSLNTNCISELIKQFASPDIAAVGGRVAVRNANQNWLTMMQTIKYFIGYEFLKGLENAFGSVMCLSGCLTAYRRHALIRVEPKLLGRRIGQIRIKYGEDRYLTRQIVQLGYKTKLHLKAVCFTKAPATLSNFYSQQLRWRRSNIVDFLQGTFNAWRLHPVVALHYFSMACIFVIYPTYVLVHIANHEIGVALIIHLAVLMALALHYRIGTRDLPEAYRVPAFAFLAMSVVMPVTYLLLTPVALFTLDTGSWETRKQS